MWLRVINEAEEPEDDGAVVIKNLQKLANQGSKKAKDALTSITKDQLKKLKPVMIAAEKMKDMSGNVITAVSCKSQTDPSVGLWEIDVQSPDGKKIAYVKKINVLTTSPEYIVSTSERLEKMVDNGRTYAQALSRLGFKKYIG